MFTRARIAFVLIALAVLLLLGVVVVSSGLREYIYKELTYRLLANRVVGEQVDPERIAVGLNEFVAENIYPGGGPWLDTHPCE